MIKNISKNSFVKSSKKIVRSGIELFFIGLSIPVVIIVRLLRPWIIIRFGYLMSGRIGHLAGNTDYFLSIKEQLGESDKKVIDFFGYRDISNKQILKMLSRVLNIYGFIYWVYRAEKVFSKTGINLIEIGDYNTVKCPNMKLSDESPVSFSKDEEDYGRGELEKMGISQDDKFICFQSRDSVYLEKCVSGSNWKYHSYRDVDIDNFLTAADYCSRQGYYALRIGAEVQKPIISNNRKIIDYAVKYRSDFLDIFLLAKSEYFIGSSCGMMAVARLFRKPIVWTNVIPLYFSRGCEYGNKDIFIFKKLWMNREDRLMTIREMVSTKAWGFSVTNSFEENGLVPIENTSEEILEVSIEMHQKLLGELKYSEEDEFLQKKFWSILSESGDFVVPESARVGTSFLRNNQFLLN